MLSSMEGNVHHLNEGHFVLDAERASSCQPPLLFTYPLGKSGLALGRKTLPYTDNYLKWHLPSSV
jgi:hypothetical protein